MSKTAATVAAVVAWSIEVASWLVRGEPNEDGEETVDEIYFVTAIDPDGLIYRHFHTFDSQEAADRLAARVSASPSWVGPLESPHWRYWRTMYGSPAYSRNWRRLEAETELMDREAELGPGPAAYDSLPDCMKFALG